ncbi:MAG: sulfurtransferase [Nitrospirae bacterium]|nr:sulfurtransferase [Nitrospirota bacterium]
MWRSLALVFVLVAFLLAPMGVAQSAQRANPDLLVTPEIVEKNITKPGWVVVDCRDEKAYTAGHIGGAISLGGPCEKVLRDPTARVKKTADIEKLLGSAGISEDKHVVVYSDAKGITSASVAFWILEYLGHKNVHFMNGGIESWQAEGKPLDTVETKLPAATYRAKVVKNRIATSSEMVKIARGQLKNVNVIDSRTEKENKGADIRALRGGYIPNTTINVSHTETYDKKTGKILPMDELERLFGKLNKNKRTIGYCQTGTRSTLTYLELRLMGFKDPANYDDSWIVYGSNVNYPVANENWYDFVKVNKALKAIEELEKMLEEKK